MAIARVTSGVTGKVFDVWNYDTYTIDLDMPIEVFAIPETTSEDTQLIKAQGNISSVSLTWLLAQPPALTLEQRAAWPSTQFLNRHYIDLSNGTAGVIAHSWGIENQRAYLRAEFERRSVTDLTDTIEILDVRNQSGAPIAPRSVLPADMSRGVINKLLLTRDSTEPVNIRATISMFIGTGIGGR